LYQCPGFARDIRFRPHPLRSRRFGRPQDDHGLGSAQPLLDDVAVGAVSGQFVVAPDAVAGRAQGIRDLLGLGFGRPAIRYENVGHEPRPHSNEWIANALLEQIFAPRYTRSANR